MTIDDSVVEEEGEDPLSFSLLVEKVLSASVRFMRWCPTMDLIAVVTTTNQLWIQRTGEKVWQKLFSVTDQNIPILSVSWRPDGKALAVGFADGQMSIYCIENGQWSHTYKRNVPTVEQSDRGSGQHKNKKEKGEIHLEKGKEEGIGGGSFFEEISSISIEPNESEVSGNVSQFETPITTGQQGSSQTFDKKEQSDKEKGLEDLSIIKLEWIQTSTALPTSSLPGVTYPDDNKELVALSALGLNDLDQLSSPGVGPLPLWDPPTLEEVTSKTPFSVLALFRHCGLIEILAYGRLPIVEIAQPTLQELIRSHLPLSLDSRDEDPQKEEKILAKENQELDFRLVTGFLTDDLKRVELSLELNPPSNSLFQEGESVIDESSLVSSNLEQLLVSISTGPLGLGSNSIFVELCCHLTNISICEEAISKLLGFLQKLWSGTYNSFLNQYLRMLEKHIAEDGETSTPTLMLMKRMALGAPSPLMDRFLQRGLSLPGTRRLKKRMEGTLSTIQNICSSTLTSLLDRIIAEIGKIKAIADENFSSSSLIGSLISEQICNQVIDHSFLVSSKVEELVLVCGFLRKKMRFLFEWTEFEQKKLDTETSMPDAWGTVVVEVMDYVRQYLNVDLVGQYFEEKLQIPIHLLKLEIEGGEKEKDRAASFTQKPSLSSRGARISRLISAFSLGFGERATCFSLESSFRSFKEVFDTTVFGIKKKLQHSFSLNALGSLPSTSEPMVSYIWRESQKVINSKKPRWVRFKERLEQSEDPDEFSKSFLLSALKDLGDECSNRLCLFKLDSEFSFCTIEVESEIVDFKLYRNSLLVLRVDGQNDLEEKEEEEEEEEDEREKEKIFLRLSQYQVPSSFQQVSPRNSLLYSMGNLLSVESQKVTEIKGRSFPFPSASISSAPRRDVMNGITGGPPIIEVGSGRGVCVLYSSPRRVLILDLEEDEDDEEEEEDDGESGFEEGEVEEGDGEVGDDEE